MVGRGADGIGQQGITWGCRSRGGGSDVVEAEGVGRSNEEVGSEGVAGAGEEERETGRYRRCRGVSVVPVSISSLRCDSLTTEVQTVEWGDRAGTLVISIWTTSTSCAADGSSGRGGVVGIT